MDLCTKGICLLRGVTLGDAFAVDGIVPLMRLVGKILSRDEQWFEKDWVCHSNNLIWIAGSVELNG